MASWGPRVLVLALVPISASSEAAGPLKAPWGPVEKVNPARSFGLPDQLPLSRPDKILGSHIIAGSRLMPNAMFGFGLFGQKSEQSPLDRATAREHDLPKQRKAAVGFSFRF